MALTEITVIKSVTTNLTANEIFVVKETKIFRDGVEIASSSANRYFNPTEATEFAAEVENAQQYITAMGW